MACLDGEWIFRSVCTHADGLLAASLRPSIPHAPIDGQPGCAGFSHASGINRPWRLRVRVRRAPIKVLLCWDPNVENGMDRAQKTELVAELNRSFAEVGVVVVTRNLGMTVSQSTKLRNAMRDAGATYKVSKNKLAKIALDGTDYGSLSDMLTGPVGLASSIDPVAAAKVVVEFAKTNDKFEIVGGAMGATALDVAGVQALATLPSLDELRAKIVGLLVAPATKIATITQAPAAQLARVLSAYAEKEAA
jgi:large subunit ribosomal protein L10